MLVGVKDPIRLLRRIAVSVVGTVILVVGMVLLVAPGPGLVVIELALAVFAIEYQWARRNFVVVQARARSAALKAAASRVATASAVLFGMGAIGLGGVLVFTDLLPLSGVGTSPLRVKDMTTGVFGRLGAFVSDVRACLGLRDGVWAGGQPRAAAVWSAGELLDGGRGDRVKKLTRLPSGSRNSIDRLPQGIVVGSWTNRFCLAG